MSISHQRPAGYTVLELAVTMSITIGAFGLLVPAIGSARQSVTQSGCMTNMKGLTQANLNYAADHGKCVPDERRPAYLEGRDGTIELNRSAASDSLAWTPETVDERRASWFGPLETAYLGGDLTRVDCPVINRHRWAAYDIDAGAWNWPVDYSINRFGLNVSPDIADDPSRNVMFGEPNMERATIHFVGEVIAFYLWWGDDPARRSDLEQWRAGSLSFGFVDGHASRVAISPVKFPFLERFPELALSAGSPAPPTMAFSNYFWWNESQVVNDRRTPVFPIPNDLVDRR